MKRNNLIVTFLLAILIMSLSACGSSNNSYESTENNTQSTETEIVKPDEVSNSNESKNETYEKTDVYLTESDNLLEYTKIENLDKLEFYIPNSILDKSSTIHEYMDAAYAAMYGETTSEYNEILENPIVIEDEQSYTISDLYGNLIINIYSTEYSELYNIEKSIDTFENNDLNTILDSLINLQTEDTTEDSDTETSSELVQVASVYADEIIAKDDTKIIAKVSGKLFGANGYPDINEYGYLSIINTPNGLVTMAVLSNNDSDKWPIIAARSFKYTGDYNTGNNA